jgi:hypothetical protein
MGGKTQYFSKTWDLVGGKDFVEVGFFLLFKDD